MLDLETILVHGAVLSVSGSCILLAAVRFNPRLAARDLPEEIQARTPLLTKGERLQATLFAVPFLALVLVVPLLSGLSFVAQSEGGVPFLLVFLPIFSVLFVFNLVDLLILEWLIYCTLTPTFVVIPETEDLPAYKDFSDHLRAQLRCLVLQAVVSLALAGLARVSIVF